MKTVFSSIKELRQLRKHKQQILEMEKNLAIAMIKDLSMIPKVKALFCEHIADVSISYNRKKLLFVILCLFAPDTLAGGRLPKGLRMEISKIFPGIRPCTISNEVANLYFFYQHYKDFRNDVESIYESILDGLKA